MIRVFLFIIVLVFLQSCGNEREQRAAQLAEQKKDSLLTVRLQLMRKMAEREAAQIELNNLYQNRRYNPDSISDSLIIAYEIHCPWECGHRNLFTNRTGKEKVISRASFLELIQVLDTPKTYGGYTAACFHPKVGVISYDAKKRPQSYIGICLSCNNQTSNIDFDDGVTNKTTRYGYSKNGRHKIRNILNQWGFDHSKSYSSFDSKQEYGDFLKREGWSAEKIEEELKGPYK